ncbi:MAG: leucyl aminopeptidase family protein [Rhodospirillaceae bacterium]|nr:leucyl aminopeptidase family protein [Rhodospirillaceae bacterium]
MSALAVVVDGATGAAIPIHAVATAKLAEWQASRPAHDQAWLKAIEFKAESGSVAHLRDDHGQLSAVVVGLGKGDDPWACGGLAKQLPPGIYRLHEFVGCTDSLQASFPTWAAQAWALGAYAFKRYKKPDPDKDKPLAQLAWPEGCDRDGVTRTINAAALARDLINTPAADMLPDRLAEAVRSVGREFGATITEIIGDELLTQNYPAIHAVGRASSVAPRLIDLTWGRADHPKVTLVGKGVCFDSGGLDIKPSSGMALMKKDMGGAAILLGLAQMIMAAKLPVRLRLLVPAVENAVAGNAFRPGDVLASRKGLNIEIGNTDAEGRLILADALAEAVTEKPTLLIDAATLTGAARTALGPELPALFTDDEALASDLMAASRATFDPLWRLPLWAPYRKMIDSKVADINNAGESPFAGAITAALFLKDFVGEGVAWAHLDVFAWNPADKPGRPQGGEAMTQRALFGMIAKRFAT